MTSTDTGTTFLTQDAFDRLKAEHDQLTTSGRSEIAAKIEEARQEGDLKENGGYHAAKEEQGKMEARIRTLEELLRNATVGDAPKADGTVHPGMIVKAEIFGEEENFLLGSREGAADDLTVYSEKSPLGAAILDQKVGSTVSYEAPNGKTIEVKIVSASPYKG